MNTKPLRILLADDDEDDCYFFREALDDFSITTTLTIVHDGEQLLDLLQDETVDLPAVLFLDLNMPLKSGYECLQEVRLSLRLRQLPVVILSTFISLDVEDKLYRSGATYCIIKPTHVVQLKEVIQRALVLIANTDDREPARATFIIKAT